MKRRVQTRRMSVERLEDRRLLSVGVTGRPDWVHAYPRAPSVLAASQYSKKPPKPTPPPVPPPIPPPTPIPAPELPAYLPNMTAYTAATSVAGLIASTSSGQVLVILGTEVADAITLSESGSTFSVASGASTQTFTGTFAGIAVYGFGGNDTLRFTSTIAQSLTTVLYAGVGDDTLYEAGPDKAYLYGQDGNDMLVSVGGNADILAGGQGLDSLWLDTTDWLVDVETIETVAKSVHKVAAFQGAPLEIAGQDMIDPAASYAYTNLFINRPLWVDGPRYNDIAQGQVGDCYFLAGLSAMADTDPALLRQSVAALGDGTYAVRFYRNGSEVYYRVDAQLPTLGTAPAYAKLSKTGELWVALEEKAFAMFRYGQYGYTGYQYIAGGSLQEPYVAVLGATYSTLYGSGSADVLAQSVASALADGHAVSAGSDNVSGSPIVAAHAYAVRSSTLENGVWFVTVYNPWGFDGRVWDAIPSDGLLRMTAAQFLAWFQYSVVCLA